MDVWEDCRQPQEEPEHLEPGDCCQVCGHWIGQHMNYGAGVACVSCDLMGVFLEGVEHPTIPLCSFFTESVRWS